MNSIDRRKFMAILGLAPLASLIPGHLASHSLWIPRETWFRECHDPWFRLIHPCDLFALLYEPHYKPGTQERIEVLFNENDPNLFRIDGLLYRQSATFPPQTKFGKEIHSQGMADGRVYARVKGFPGQLYLQTSTIWRDDKSLTLWLLIVDCFLAKCCLVLIVNQAVGLASAGTRL